VGELVLQRELRKNAKRDFSKTGRAILFYLYFLGFPLEGPKFTVVVFFVYMDFRCTYSPRPERGRDISAMIRFEVYFVSCMIIVLHAEEGI